MKLDVVAPVWKAKIPIPAASSRSGKFKFKPNQRISIMSDIPIRLTQTVSGAGWASKLAPGDLDKALCGLKLPQDDNVLVGLEGADDAGVYRISEDLAIIQTVDFFTPIVDDPFWFGQIAAANALSDIYAMSGDPKTAMNLVAFPSDQMDISILHAILEGGLKKMEEAGVVLLGGHSVKDKEIKYIWRRVKMKKRIFILLQFIFINNVKIMIIFKILDVEKKLNNFSVKLLMDYLNISWNKISNPLFLFFLIPIYYNL